MCSLADIAAGINQKLEKNVLLECSFIKKFQLVPLKLISRDLLARSVLSSSIRALA